MKVATCADCGRQFDVDRDPPPKHCFKCKVSGIGFTFTGGGGYGRETFHGGTNREFERSIHEHAKLNGIEIDRA